MTFPSSKSWVELAWTVDDRSEGRLSELGLDLDLAIDGSPTLVDLGANSTVYGTIKDDERLWLNAGREGDWQVYKYSGRRAVLQAASIAGRGDPSLPKAEGWAHVMDSRRCTAVAVADFGRHSSDRIEVFAS